MKRILLAAALTLLPALFPIGKAAAQTTGEYGTEVCVNASNVEDAKRLFPNTSLHVVPDSPNDEANGWRIVSGYRRSDGRIMTDAEEVHHRLRELNFRAPGE